MTLPTMPRLPLAAALALGLAVAPSAQTRMAADDADAPGVVIATPPAFVDLEFFDDQDPRQRAQPRAVVFSQSAARADGIQSDRDDPSVPMGFSAVVSARFAPALDTGRDGTRTAAASATLAPVGELANGRTDESLAAARTSTVAEIAVEDLDTGRPPGTRPQPVVSDDAPQAVAPLADAAPETGRADGLGLSVVQPNPARTAAWVTASVDATQRATVTIYDVRGRQLAVAFDGVVTEDTPTRVRLDLDALSAGTYVVVLEANGVRSSQTLQVVR